MKAKPPEQPRADWQLFSAEPSSRPEGLLSEETEAATAARQRSESDAAFKITDTVEQLSRPVEVSKQAENFLKALGGPDSASQELGADFLSLDVE